MNNDLDGFKIELERSLQYSRHLGDFISDFIPDSSNPDLSKFNLVLLFLGYCVDELSSIEYTEPEMPNENPNSYNPPRTGIAYYFTPSGNDQDFLA